jgi:DNA-directed RNA polymerase subunit RPC12/RpoP
MGQKRHRKNRDTVLELQCPNCSGRACVVRTRPRWWHWSLATIFKLHVYRCRACNHRFTSK